jgi:hypothetical protein
MVRVRGVDVIARAISGFGRVGSIQGLDFFGTVSAATSTAHAYYLLSTEAVLSSCRGQSAKCSSASKAYATSCPSTGDTGDAAAKTQDRDTAGHQAGHGPAAEFAGLVYGYTYGAIPGHIEPAAERAGWAVSGSGPTAPG